VFAVAAVGGTPGLIEGNVQILGVQALSVVVTAAYSFVATWIIVKLLDVTVVLRVSEQDEERGLDQAVHGEEGYAL
jgi:Ammonia permease